MGFNWALVDSWGVERSGSGREVVVWVSVVSCVVSTVDASTKAFSVVVSGIGVASTVGVGVSSTIGVGSGVASWAKTEIGAAKEFTNKEKEARIDKSRCLAPNFTFLRAVMRFIHYIMGNCQIASSLSGLQQLQDALVLSLEDNTFAMLEYSILPVCLSI